MPKSFSRLPKELIDKWPEIFDELYIDTVPIEYLEDIRLEFHDGRIWEISVDNQSKDHLQEFSERFHLTLSEYTEEIKSIKYKINIEKLKKDIKKSTKNIL